MKTFAPILTTLLLFAFAMGTSTGETESHVSQDKQFKIKSKGNTVRVQDKSKPVRAALEKQYETAARAYFEDDPEPVLALRAPGFMARLPNGQFMSKEDSHAYVRASFDQVKRNLHVSFDIEELTTRGDTAIATIHQQWRRI